MNGQVFIIGLGLIGGSLALSIKKKHPEAFVIGYDLDHKQCELGKMLGVIDDFAKTIDAGAVSSDLIIICTPVRETIKIVKDLAKMPLKSGVIITDAGSTKRFIVEEAAILRNNGMTFIGGHPMAGSHKSGVTAAKDMLFENAFYILTPDESVKQEKIQQLKEWLSGTKARFLELTPFEHDQLTGVVSHFPHIIAASLVHHTEKSEDDKSLIPRLAAGGFRDITRIASSSPEMWKDILQQNKSVLLDLLDRWQLEMSSVKSMLLRNDSQEIFDYFLSAKNFRDGLPIKEKGAIPSFYDLFVDVPDYPGVISEITGYLANAKISIINIRILETRGDVYGVLVISFQSDEDRAKAQKCIEEHTDYVTTPGT